MKSKPSRHLRGFQVEFNVYRHIAAFGHALQEDESYFDNAGDNHPSPNGAATPQSGYGTRIRKVSALSDFAPINTRVRR